MSGNRNSEALVGTLYLKRAYRHNLLVAETSIIIAIGLAIAISALLWSGTAEVTTIERITYDTPTNVLPPPPPRVIETEVTHSAPPQLPDLTMVEAIDDTLVIDDHIMPSQQEISVYNSVQASEFVDGAVYGGPVLGVEEFIPSPDSFVAVDEQPKALHFPAVHYPEIARQMNIEGSVWLKVLINTDGNVVDVIVAIPSKVNVGFDEAAEAAARESKWRPAMQNKQPIMVWVSYEVRFRLK